MAGSFDLIPMSDVLGAEVRGLDITAKLDDSTITALESTWADHEILLFRDLDLSPGEQVTFSAQLGKLSSHTQADYALPNHPEIFIVSSNVDEKARPSVPHQRACGIPMVNIRRPRRLAHFSMASIFPMKAAILCLPP